MKKYTSLFRIRFLHGLQYRSAAFAGIVTQFAWGFMEICLFKAFYEAEPNAFPIPFTALCSYVWLQQAFLALYMAWFWEHDIFESIKNGNVSYELCRPIGLYEMWFTRSMATRVSKAVLRSLPILVIVFFLPDPYRLVLPIDPTSAIFFLISMVLGLLVMVSLNMIVYIFTFYLMNTQGITMVFMSISELLSGACIPLAFLPLTYQKWIALLPFASVQNAPFRIYSGEFSGVLLKRTLTLQLMWVILLVLLGKILLKHALKRVVVQGG